MYSNPSGATGCVGAAAAGRPRAPAKSRCYSLGERYVAFGTKTVSHTGFRLVAEGAIQGP
jgi:hypothetical protein